MQESRLRGRGMTVLRIKEEVVGKKSDGDGSSEENMKSKTKAEVFG